MNFIDLDGKACQDALPACMFHHTKPGGANKNRIQPYEGVTEAKRCPRVAGSYPLTPPVSM